MNRLAYIDMIDAGGALLQRGGTLLASEVLASATPGTGERNRLRALTDASRKSDPLSFRLHRAIAEILASLDREPGPVPPNVFQWREGQAPSPLRGRDLAESLDVWQRNARPGDVLVQIQASDPAAVHALGHTISEFYGDFHALLLPQRSLHQSPVQSRLEDATTAWRVALASDWPTPSAVSRMLGSTAANASSLATKLRSAGRLLGVYLTTSPAGYRFPPWQFQDGQPVAHLAEILGMLRKHTLFHATDRRTAGWAEVEWFLTPHPLLGDVAPAALLTSAPDRVLAAAQQDSEA